MEPKRNAPKIMAAAKHTLALFALIVVVVESTFVVLIIQLSGFAQLLTIAGMIVILCLVIGIAGIRWTSPSETIPKQITSIWSKDDIPISEDLVECLKGRWNCRWTYRKKSGKFAKYVDDIIDIHKVETKTGIIEGKGKSAYDFEKGYKVYGRVSKKGLIHLFYSTPPPKMRLAGMVIMRIATMGELRGWWLGTDREGGDIGGNTIWKPETEDPNFKICAYPVTND